MGCLISILIVAAWVFGALILGSFGITGLLIYIAVFLVTGLTVLIEWSVPW
jgi:hypothetical protein